MAGESPPARRYTVVQTGKETDEPIYAAIISKGSEPAVLDLKADDGSIFTVEFRPQSTDHDKDGSHLIVGITDLDVVINVQINADGTVNANLSK